MYVSQFSDLQPFNWHKYIYFKSIFTCTDHWVRIYGTTVWFWSITCFIRYRGNINILKCVRYCSTKSCSAPSRGNCILPAYIWIFLKLKSAKMIMEQITSTHFHIGYTSRINCTLRTNTSFINLYNCNIIERGCTIICWMVDDLCNLESSVCSGSRVKLPCTTRYLFPIWLSKDFPSLL